MPSANVLEQKKQIVADLVENLKAAQAGVLVDYRGITVEQDTQLRAKLREAGVEYKVVKNTLTRFAAKEVGFEALEIKAGFLDGKVITIDEVKKLASTPSKEVLIAKVMGSLNAPISKLVRTLQALVDNGVEPADIKVDAPVAEETAAPAEEAPAAE